MVSATIALSSPVILRRLRRDKGLSILVTDHNVREALSMTDRSYIIAFGRILAQGTPAALVRDEVVRKTYLGEDFYIEFAKD